MGAKQIGWSNESNLLWDILNKINKLGGAIANLVTASTPKYKVYTALLTQSGAPINVLVGGDENINVGVTYQIMNNPDNNNLTIYGAPNNDIGTYFVANQSVLLPYTSSLQLIKDTGAPVITILENTLGNVWTTYLGAGQYYLLSDSLFTNNKTALFIQGSNDGDLLSAIILDKLYYNDVNSLILAVNNIVTLIPTDGLLNKTTIEIRVYN